MGGFVMSGKRGAKHFTAKVITRIEGMNQEGKTHREIAESLGMERQQIKEYFHRKHRKERKLAMGNAPRPKGRPRKGPETTALQSRAAGPKGKERLTTQ